jgi:hypothetical protein
MYVGRSNRNLKGRTKQYTYSKPPIGFASGLCKDIIRERGGEIPEKIKKDSQDLKESRHRISEMNVRFIGLEDPKEQAIFELYAQIELDPKYNDFDTH